MWSWLSSWVWYPIECTKEKAKEIAEEAAEFDRQKYRKLAYRPESSSSLNLPYLLYTLRHLKFPLRYSQFKNLDLEREGQRWHLIVKGFQNQHKFQIRHKARVFQVCSDQNQPNLYCRTGRSNCSCPRQHRPSLDQYTIAYYDARAEAKKKGLSIWVYFAQKNKQDLF